MIWGGFPLFLEIPIYFLEVISFCEMPNSSSMLDLGSATRRTSAPHGFTVDVFFFSDRLSGAKFWEEIIVIDPEKGVFL